MTNYNFFVPAMFIFVFASCLGCLFVVVAWAKILMEPPGSTGPRGLNALYLFTASVAVEALGSGVVTAIPQGLRSVAWLLVLIAGFALVVGSLLTLRQTATRAPEKRAVKAGGIVLLVIYGLGFIAMIATLPAARAH